MKLGLAFDIGFRLMGFDCPAVIRDVGSLVLVIVVDVVRGRRRMVICDVRVVTDHIS